MTNPPPKYLYKFREFSKLHISSVANNKVWLAAPDTLNDRQDINLTDILVDAPSEPLRRGIQYISDDLRSNSGVYSLSAAPLSHKMWTMYASNGKGFCIEYDTTSCEKNRNFLLPVLYSNEERNYQAVKILLNESSDLKNIEIRKTFLQYLFCRKSLYWEFEKEFRLFSNKPFPSKTDNSRLCPIPFSVSSIIVGPFANSEDVLKLRSEFKSNGRSTPPLKKVVHDQRTGDYSIRSE